MGYARKRAKRVKGPERPLKLTRNLLKRSRSAVLFFLRTATNSEPWKAKRSIFAASPSRCSPCSRRDQARSCPRMR